MPIPAERILKMDSVVNFGQIQGQFELSDLTQIQTDSYDRFLQLDKRPGQRRNQGLEEILREVFPIESYDGQYRLEYVRYELGKPRYTPTECRQLRLTYGRPFRVWLRLMKEQPIEEEVYLGDMPIMIGGGEFIINGAERVVVSQLHRSPGVDFVHRRRSRANSKTYSCRVIPERGSWIELRRQQEGHAGRPHRPERQVLGDDAAARDGRRSTRPTTALLKLFYNVKTVKVVEGDADRALVGKLRRRRHHLSRQARPRAARSSSKCGQPITQDAGRRRSPSRA